MKRIYFGLCLFILLGNQCLLAGLNDGLVAYYPFNGNANDMSGNGNNATFVGSVTNAPNRFGRLGMAAFIGANGRVSLPSTSALRSSATTYSFWYQAETNILTDQPYNSICVLLNSGPDHHPLLFMNASPGSAPPGTPAMTLGYWYYGFRGANNIIPIGQWTHFGLVINGSSRKIYVNGSLIFQANDYFGNVGYPVTDIGNFPEDPNTHSARGAFDDVRIYNRALSPTEIQSLSVDIGTAPTPPTVVQTNRAPTSTEVGSQINGNFKVFTNGTFVSGVVLDPSKRTIVLTHGWNSSSADWPASMASQLVAGGISANIVAWDWRDDAKYDRSTTLSKTPWQGFLLGSNLLQNLGAGYSQPIHFIGHSFGTLVNAAAANYLHGEAPNNNPQQHLSPSRTQITLLDEAEIANVLGKPKVVNPTTANLGWIKPLPNSFAWSDNYVSAVGELHDNAVNIILTENSPGIFYSSLTGLWNALVIYHSEPCGWYGDTILNPTGSVMGNIWSFERTNSFATPAAGTCFVQHDNGLALDQISRYAADDFRAKQFGALLEEVAVYYALKGVNAAVHVVGDVTANVIETALTDSNPVYQTTPATIGISSYAPATPDFWSPQLILQNHPLILPAPLIAFKGITPKDASSTSSNSPAYAWLPMTIPTNATAMSFDFMIQGDGAGDSFDAALNGTNVFSLATSLIQTNVTMNSGLIDVSSYAGQNVELFLGIVGGASTNTILTVSGIRLYSMASPLLQALASGNNCVLSWPLSAADYVLQTSTNLTDTNSWTAGPNVPAIVNLQNTVTNSASDGARFYRLKK